MRSGAPNNTGVLGKPPVQYGPYFHDEQRRTFFPRRMQKRAMVGRHRGCQILLRAGRQNLIGIFNHRFITVNI